MRIVKTTILNLLLLSFSMAPCHEGIACGTEMALTETPRAHSSPEDVHCCQGQPAEESSQEGNCPPSCQCTCCPAPAVALASAPSLPALRPHSRKPAVYNRHYQSDFHHLIWQPPQFL